MALSIFAAGTVANGIGLLFSWLDVCTIFVYFAIVDAFL